MNKTVCKMRALRAHHTDTCNSWDDIEYHAPRYDANGKASHLPHQNADILPHPTPLVTPL